MSADFGCRAAQYAVDRTDLIRTFRCATVREMCDLLTQLSVKDVWYGLCRKWAISLIGEVTRHGGVVRV